MKNMISKFAALAVLSSMSLSAVAGTVTLKAEDSSLQGSSLEIVAVAKINGTLEVDLINAGLAENLDLVDSDEVQRFAFGMPGEVAGDAEGFSINPTITIAEGLKAHVCGENTADAGSIQRLIEDEDRLGSCDIQGSADTVSAEWKVTYKVRASGGAVGSLMLAYDNGVDENLIPDSNLAFLGADMVAAGFGVLPRSINDGEAGSLADQDSDVITYSVSFDVRGSQSKAESRARFQHILQLQP